MNGHVEVHRAILDAAGRLSDYQVVLSVGDEVDLADLGPVPPNTIVVPTALQIELLERASLCITHAGINTVLEALARGVPMVAIPIAYDQPGAVARIAYHGVGEFIEVADLGGAFLFELIAKVHATLVTGKPRNGSAKDRQPDQAPRALAGTHRDRRG